jgi:hypothetical protein
MKTHAIIPLCGTPGEGHKRGWPSLIKMDEAACPAHVVSVVKAKVEKLFGGK